MGLIRMGNARESAPIVLNLIKDSGWCYSWGMVSVITIIPVLSFQVYEIWKARKEGTHKVMQNIAGMFAVMANGTWMVGDLYFHDGFHKYSKLLFLLGFVFIGLFGIFSWKQARTARKSQPQRTMMVSKETGNVIFVHSKLAHIRKPMTGRNVVMVRHRTARH